MKDEGDLDLRVTSQATVSNPKPFRYNSESHDTLDPNISRSYAHATNSVFTFDFVPLCTVRSRVCKAPAISIYGHNYKAPGGFRVWRPALLC